MENIIKKIISNENVEEILKLTIESIYKNGPTSTTDLEILCYIKIFNPELFKLYEHQILKFMGLHFKDLGTESLLEVVFGMYQRHIEDEYNIKYTPVQSKIVDETHSNKYFSFSAPTSTGKSFVFRKLIEESDKDVVIVVPSRALINEYFELLNEQFTSSDINLLTFVDKINTKHATRNIFILTPERCKDLFKFKNDFDVDFFLFDEAQLGDEKSARGLYFDSIIRRAKRSFPGTKFIFAHPFIENPNAQFEKNNFEQEQSNARNFNIKNVGQIFYSLDKDNSFYHFGIDKNIMGKSRVKCDYDPIEIVLSENGSVLVFCTKTSILSHKIFKEFEKYLRFCEVLSDPEAMKIIAEIADIIGGSDDINEDRYSEVIKFLKIGVVTHHGSMPLRVRSLIEKFTKSGFCKICFATSTLEQGINMPFDLVYLNHFTESKPLAIKNIIGRAGRSTLDKKFDYGTVIIRHSNISAFRKIMHSPSKLRSKSLLDDTLSGNLSDLEEFRKSINDGSFSDEYNLTPKQIEVLSTDYSLSLAHNIIECLFMGNDFTELKQIDNRKLSNEFEKVYELHIGRILSKGEKSVIDTSVQIMIWRIFGKSFKDICFYRYAYVSRKTERENPSVDNSELDSQFVMPCSDIPNKSLSAFPLFPQGTKASDVNYDLIVFDTYDYLDKILNFRLEDIFVTLFHKYFEKTGDLRAEKLVKLIKYGTDSDKKIWLLRYGFDFDDVEWIEPYVQSIDSTGIEFDKEILQESEKRLKIIDRYYNG